MCKSGEKMKKKFLNQKSVYKKIIYCLKIIKIFFIKSKERIKKLE